MQCIKRRKPLNQSFYGSNKSLASKTSKASKYNKELSQKKSAPMGRGLGFSSQVDRSICNDDYQAN